MKKSLPFFMLLFSTSIVGFAQQRILQKEVDKQGNISLMASDNKTSYIPVGHAKRLLHDIPWFQKDDVVVLKEEMKDNLGFTYQFYNQYYKRIDTKSQQPSISGPSTLCSSGSTYSISNLPTGYTVTWNSSSNIILQANPASNTATANLNGQGYAWIQATFTSSTETIVSPLYPIWIGTPSISNVSGPTGSLVGASSAFTATLSDVRANVTSFNWTLIPSVYNNYFAPNGNYCYITWYTASNYVLSVNAQNACGTSSTYYYPLYVGAGSSLSVSPNPATDNIRVSIMKTQNNSLMTDNMLVTSQTTTTGSQYTATTYTVRIYNSFGTLFYSTKKSGDTFTIPVNNLKDGTYFIEANDGKQSYRQQIIINH